MKLLFDQNISFRILNALETEFPGSVQVKSAGLEDKTDLEIWTFAKDKGFTIVTFDADFADILSLKGFPPKIIWLRIFDQRTSVVLDKLKEKKSEIKEFIPNPDFGVLEVK
jgi:predicted nuclease of predicted toxin-antitoxin system